MKKSKKTVNVIHVTAIWNGRNFFLKKKLRNRTDTHTLSLSSTHILFTCAPHRVTFMNMSDTHRVVERPPRSPVASASGVAVGCSTHIHQIQKKTAEYQARAMMRPPRAWGSKWSRKVFVFLHITAASFSACKIHTASVVAEVSCLRDPWTSEPDPHHNHTQAGVGRGRRDRESSLPSCLMFGSGDKTRWRVKSAWERGHGVLPAVRSSCRVVAMSTSEHMMEMAPRIRYFPILHGRDRCKDRSLWTHSNQWIRTRCKRQEEEERNVTTFKGLSDAKSHLMFLTSTKTGSLNCSWRPKKGVFDSASTVSIVKLRITTSPTLGRPAHPRSRWNLSSGWTPSCTVSWRWGRRNTSSGRAIIVADEQVIRGVAAWVQQQAEKANHVKRVIWTCSSADGDVGGITQRIWKEEKDWAHWCDNSKLVKEHVTQDTLCLGSMETSHVGNPGWQGKAVYVSVPPLPKVSQKKDTGKTRRGRGTTGAKAKVVGSAAERTLKRQFVEWEGACSGWTGPEASATTWRTCIVFCEHSRCDPTLQIPSHWRLEIQDSARTRTNSEHYRRRATDKEIEFKEPSAKFSSTRWKTKMRCRQRKDVERWAQVSWWWRA